MGRLWALSPQTIPRAAGAAGTNATRESRFIILKSVKYFDMSRHPSRAFSVLVNNRLSPSSDGQTHRFLTEKPSSPPSLQLLVFPWAGRTSLLGNASWPARPPHRLPTVHCCLTGSRSRRAKEKPNVRAYCRIKTMSTEKSCTRIFCMSLSKHFLKLWRCCCAF